MCTIWTVTLRGFCCASICPRRRICEIGKIERDESDAYGHTLVLVQTHSVERIAMHVELIE